MRKAKEKRKIKQKIIKVELNPEVEEFKRSELPGKYTVRILLDKMITSLRISI